MLRILLVILAIWLAYYLVTKYIQPKVLEPNCLTNTNGCLNVNLWKDKNSFLAQILPMNQFAWFDGSLIYIYNQSPGTCENPDQYSPVVVIKPTLSQGVLTFQRKPDECIPNVATVSKSYVNIPALKDNNISLYYRSKGGVLSMIDVFQQLANDGYISTSGIIN